MKPIQERVKTYEDALAVLGETPRCFEGMTKDEIAFIKLKAIVKALNEGWTPELRYEEYRYYPWFYLHTKSEIEDMDNFKGLLFGGSASYGAYAGLSLAATINAPSFASAYYGSRLCLKSEELAEYCGKQFIQLWCEYLFPQKIIKNKR